MGFSNDQKSRVILAAMKTIKEGAVGKEVSTPYFIIKDKVDNEWVEKERFKTLSATPISIELSSYMWKNAPVDTVKLTMMDGEDKIQLEFNLDNGLSRNLLNTMLGESIIGELAMSLYINKAGYPSIGIENDGEKTQWKYKHEEFPAVTKNTKGVVIDNEEYIAFMKRMVLQIDAKLKSNPLPEKKVTMKPNENIFSKKNDKQKVHGEGSLEEGDEFSGVPMPSVNDAPPDDLPW